MNQPKIQKDNRLEPISRWLEKLSDFGAKLVLTASLALIGIYRWMSGKTEEGQENFFTFFSVNVLGWTSFIIIILLFIFSLNEQLLKKARADLESELEATKDQLNEFGNNIQNLFDGFLSGLSNKMNFEKATKARFSIYLNDDDEEYFIPCGRYSPDPTLKKKGRTTFSHGQGCIWKAWTNDFHFDNKIPKGNDPYKRYQINEYNIPEEELEGLKMNPRLICGKRIDDRAGNPTAVLICEALEKELFTEQEVREILIPASEDLSSMITCLQDFIPNPSDAEDIGL